MKILILLALIQLGNAFPLSRKPINKTMNLNEVIELDCSSSGSATSTTRTISPSQMANKSLNESLTSYDIFIFKKDNVLINLFRTKLRLKLSNLTDQGVYECGFYRFDKYGSLDYVTQQTWIINISRK